MTFENWIYWIGGIGLAYLTVIIWWLWKANLKKCQRCKLRGMNCDCIGGPR